MSSRLLPPLRVRAAVATCAAIALSLVAAVDAMAGSDVSGPGSATNLRVVAVGDRSVTVSWNAPEAVQGQIAPTAYRVFFREVAAEPGSQPNVGTGWAESDLIDAAARLETTVRELTNGVWYEMRVDSVGGAWSEETLLARPGAAPSGEALPSKPVDVAVAEEASGSVTVAWKPPDGGAPVTGYEVWYIREQDRFPDHDEWVRSGGILPWVRSGGILPSDARQHEIKGLVDYQEYMVVIAATNQTGRGTFSDETWATANGVDLDPLGLIAHHRLAMAYSLGTDLWEVWICELPQRGNVEIDLPAALALLNQEMRPYFSWLSGGKYQPEFVGGGTVNAAWSPDEVHDIYAPCHEIVETASAGDADAGLIIIDWNCPDFCPPSSGGSGSGSLVVVDGVVQPDPGSFPQNGRSVQTQPYAVLSHGILGQSTDNPDYVDLAVVAHEMGHALGWPHSFGGQTFVGSSRDPAYADQYDNPMDQISGAPVHWYLSNTGLTVGTIAVNRYAAGWIDPDDVVVHDGGVASYLLAPIGVTGTQMLAIPTGESAHFISLGARVAKGYDRGITAEGVEVYRVKQRDSELCSADGQLCYGPTRRTQQVPPPRNIDPSDPVVFAGLTDHVYGPGDGLTVEGFRVEVTERVGDRFRVWVGNPYAGTFADDENNAHEANIENLVYLGITEGCDPDLKLYCPDQPLTRAHMAEFLILALGEDTAPRSGSSRFSDVAADAWYRRFVERLAELEITVGFSDGTFRPSDPVTRGQMALFLTRAFDGVAPVDTPTGVFEDVPPDASYAAAVEGLRAAGVTQGCGKTPGHYYCPSDHVRRDQIASFLTRALRA